MSFLDGFKNALNRFRKKPVEKTVGKTSSSPALSGEVVRPEPTKTPPASKVKTSQKKEVKVHHYNWILLVIALGLTVLALLMFSGKKKSKVKDTTSSQVEAIVPQGDGSEVIEQEEQLEEKIVPEFAEIGVSDSEVNIQDHPISTPFEKTIFLSAIKGEIKILSITLEKEDPSIQLDSVSCIEVPSLVEKIGTCSLLLSWDPVGESSFSSEIKISWQDLSSLENKENVYLLPLNLNTAVKKEIKEEIKKEIIPPAIEEPKEEKGFFDSLFSSDETEKEVVAPPVKKSSKKVRRSDCRKYAVRGYSKDGSFIGWIRPSGEVYSPRCGSVIGTRKVNGEIVNSSDKLIGYDAETFVNRKKKQNAKIALPTDLIDFENTTQSEPTDWAIVAEDRSNARNSFLANAPKKGEPSAKWNKHQMSDHMGVLHSAKLSNVPFTIKGAHQVSTMPKDEEFVIRRTKPIPAVLAYPLQNNKNYGNVIPATAIIERNVYGGSGRTVVIPAGSLLLGHATGNWPKTYTRFARVALQWDRIVRPDGAEFIFSTNKPISGDAQGKLGVPGKGTTDYLEQFVKPMITSLVPAAINLISPTAELYTRKLLTDSDGDLNILETGENTSKEKAKQAMIATWNKIAHKFVEDTLDNTVPPFSVPAGTRITIYPQEDIMLRFVNDDSLFKPEGSRAQLADIEADNIAAKTAVTVSDSDTEPSGPNSAVGATADISAQLQQMDVAAQVREEEQAVAAAAAAEAAMQDDFGVDNFDPMDSFGEGGGAMEVGELADGTLILEDSQGLYREDTEESVNEADVTFFD